MAKKQLDDKRNKEAMAKAILLKIALISRKKQFAKIEEENNNYNNQKEE